MLKKQIFGLQCLAILSLSVVLVTPAFSEKPASSTKPQRQSAETESVKPQVDKKIREQATEKRKKIVAEARTAINKTEKALKALEESETKVAVAALETAIGKLELILARDPELALAPVDVDVIAHDLFADLETVKKAIDEAEDYLEEGKIQHARPLVATLASEIVFRTMNIPLATYPEAIKAVATLIDANKIDEAKKALQMALNTLVVTEEVIPLPVIRAKALLENAEELTEKAKRTEKDNKTLASQLNAARTQLKMAELLGYGTKNAYSAMYDQIDQIEEKIEGDLEAKDWFNQIKQQLSEMF